MKCSRIRVANMGPVAEGEVDLKRVVVLVGPNGTGKSIVSRLVYALRRLDSPPSLLRRLGRGGKKRAGAGGLSRVYGEAVLLHAGLDRGEIVAHARRSCRLTVSRGSARRTSPWTLALPPNHALGTSTACTAPSTPAGRTAAACTYRPAGSGRCSRLPASSA